MKVAGDQAAVLWQSSQTLLVARCVALFPLAEVPLWQLEQVAVMPAWLKVAGAQAVVVWQSAQRLPVARWEAVLPLAVVPLWHEAQLPVIPT